MNVSWRMGRAQSAQGFFLVAIVAAVLGLATVAQAACPPTGCVCPPETPVDCGDGSCCPPSNVCNPFNSALCCPPDLPVTCTNTCCGTGEHCSADGSNCGASCPAGSTDCGDGHCCAGGETCNPLRAGFCCAPGTTGCATGICCPAGTSCTPDGQCAATCDVDCGNGLCCPTGNTCNTMNPQTTFCCSPENSVQCHNGCCSTGSTCNTVNPNLCCNPGFPVSCQNTCCAAGFECSSDGNSCVGGPPMCSEPAYPVDCHDGFCCPDGSRCGSAPLRGGDVLYPACCIDPPHVPDCCSGKTQLADTLGGVTTNAAHSGGGSKCPKQSTKVRPFEVLQVAAGSNGAPASFDIANHQYSLGFALGGKKGGQVLKVPLIQEDSSATNVAALIPPFLLSKKSHGKAGVFLVTDGVVSDNCLATVRIAPLPKSPTKVRGLATLSWLRANQKVFSGAKTTLISPSAAPFVNPAIVGDVDTAITSVDKLLPSFTRGTMTKDVAKTARYSDSLVTGMLAAAQKVNDPPFASASHALMQAIAKAKDGNDASLAAAETTYANTLLNPSGPSAQSTAKFTVGCGAVTSAGVGASAALSAGGSRHTSGVIDAQATATVICGATVSATAAVAGVATIVAGAATSTMSTTAYGKTLLTGSARIAMHTQTNYGRVNLRTAKLCSCPQPPLQGVIDISITIIISCEHLRNNAPTFCLPDAGPTMSMNSGTGPCGDGTVGSGEECDPNAHPTGCSADKTCQTCRCVGTGDVRVTLLWDTVDDLDLHVIEPSGTEIYYGNTTSGTGGKLDVDSNRGCSVADMHPVENIFWGTGAAPRGTFTVKVDYFRHCGSGPQTVPFTVKTLVDGRENTFPGSVATADSCHACTDSGCNCSMITTFAR